MKTEHVNFYFEIKTLILQKGNPIQVSPKVIPYSERSQKNFCATCNSDNMTNLALFFSFHLSSGHNTEKTSAQRLPESLANAFHRIQFQFVILYEVERKK